MQKQSERVYSERVYKVLKTLTVLLLLAVIGLYTLYHWRSGNLEGQLAAHQATISEGAQQLKETKTSLDLAAQSAQELRDEIDRLKTNHQDEVQGLTGRMETQLATLKQQYEAKVQQVEDRLQARVAALQITLEGTEPERVALFASFEQRIQSAQATIAELEAAKGEIADQLTAANRTIDEDTKALADANSQLQAAQAELAQTRGKLSQLQARHAAATDETTRQRADLEAAHAAALELAAKETAALKAGLEDDLAKAKAAHTASIAKANTDIETLTASHTAATAALDTLHTKHDNLVGELKGKLADTEQALTAVQADLGAARQAAAEQKTALEQQVAEAVGRVATLEGTQETERAQAEAALAAAKQSQATAMARQRDLLVQVSALGGKETEGGLLLTLAEADLRFPVGKATLPAGDLASLDRMAALLTQFPTLTARIEGHTDASGRKETNLALSQERADAVKQALVERGVAADRMEAIGVGEAGPIGDNATKVGRGLNRRVEVYIREDAR